MTGSKNRPAAVVTVVSLAHLVLVLGLGLAWPVLAAAQAVTLAGRMGERALLVIDGKPQLLSAGASADGVRFVRWNGELAEVEHQGRAMALRVGATPAKVAAAATPAPAREIVLSAGSGGHFFASGAINGKAVRFIVDTGATPVAMGRDEALRLGLDLASASDGVSSTANGLVNTQRLVLTRVRIGDVEISNVAATVLPQPMPYLLLGNSFLGRFQMQRDNDVMRLTLR